MTKFQYQEAMDKILEEAEVFFAFGQDRFEEVRAGREVVSIGYGGFIPTNKARSYIHKLGELNKLYKETK